VYIACEGRIVGYAPLVSMMFDGDVVVSPSHYEWPTRAMSRIVLTRGGGAVAVTIPEKVVGFRGWRYRWWDYAVEQPIDLRACCSEGVVNR
jgi:hypothetical protein